MLEDKYGKTFTSMIKNGTSNNQVRQENYAELVNTIYKKINEIYSESIPQETISKWKSEVEETVHNFSQCIKIDAPFNIESMLYRFPTPSTSDKSEEGKSKKEHKKLTSVSDKNGEEKSKKILEKPENSERHNRKLTGTLKGVFKESKVPLSHFIPDTQESKKVLTYLSKYNIATLGEYVSAENYRYITIVLNSKRFSDTYKVMRENIFKYFDTYTDLKERGKSEEEISAELEKLVETFKENAEIQSDENDVVKAEIEPDVQKNDIQENSEKSNAVDERVDHVKEILPSDNDAEELGQIDVADINNEEDFFVKVKSYPSKMFVKDSDEYEALKKNLIEPYFTKLSKEYYEGGFSAEEVVDMINSEFDKLHEIIDQKREEFSAEQKRAKDSAEISKAISDGLKYHHNPDIFNDNEIIGKDFHFHSKNRTDGRNL